MELLLSFLLFDLPESFLLIATGLSMFSIPIRPHWQKAVVISLLYSIPSFLFTYFAVYSALKISILYLLMNVLVFWFLRIRIGLTVGITTSAYLILNIVQFGLIVCLSRLGVDFAQMQTNGALMRCTTYLYFFTLLGICFLCRKQGVDLRRLFPRQSSRYPFLLIALGSVELFAILLMNTQTLIEKWYPVLRNPLVTEQLPVFHAIVLFLFVIMIFVFRSYLKKTIHRVEKETQTPYLQNINDLVTAIRSIKHDAINHFTAIDGLLKVQNYPLAEEYVSHLLQEATNVVTAVEGVKNPAVSALLHSKMAVCLANYITFTVDISAKIQLAPVKSIDLVTILGNLLDNAIRATLQEAEENRTIHLEWKDDGKFQLLTVENTGPTIPKDKLVHVFDLGYTTKESGEGGVGLAVVKNVIDKYQAKIVIYSQEGITRFTIKIPLY